MCVMTAFVRSGCLSTLARMSFYLTMILPMVIAQETNLDLLLNSCMDSKHHKSQPGPESNLFTECYQWKNRSCCTEETTQRMQESSLYSFDVDHCSLTKPMSMECKNHFKRDHCFYECSPNVGPWVVSDDRSWRRQRYWKVPLCASDCELWFTACAKDFTCTDNWTNNFRWLNDTVPCRSNGSCLKNFCPLNSTCETFQTIYKTAKNFCEKVWDNSWQYTEEPALCMRLQFNESAVNPNDAVALHHAQLVAGAHVHRCSLVWLTLHLIVVWAFINRVFTVIS